MTVGAANSQFGYARFLRNGGRENKIDGWRYLEARGIARDRTYVDEVDSIAGGSPSLEKLMRVISAGDSVFVPRLGMLGFTVNEAMRRILELTLLGVKVEVPGDEVRGSSMLLSAFPMALTEMRHDVEQFRRLLGDESRCRTRPGRRRALSRADLELVLRGIASGQRSVTELCREFGVSRTTLYRYVSPTGDLREAGRAVMGDAHAH